MRFSEPSFSTVLWVLPTYVSSEYFQNGCGRVQPWCWTLCPAQQPCSRFKLSSAVPSASAPVEAAEDNITLLLAPPCYQSCSFPSLLHRRGWALTQSLCPLPQLQPAQLSPRAHCSDWAGGALAHSVLPHLTAALTPCAGRRDGWWQQCVQLFLPSWKEFSY